MKSNPRTAGSSIPFSKGDGEKPLWATERKQLPFGEWMVTVWLNTEDSALSSDIHKAIADLVDAMMAAPTKGSRGTL
jgi:hypothetical protein